MGGIFEPVMLLRDFCDFKSDLRDFAFQPLRSALRGHILKKKASFLWSLDQIGKPYDMMGAFSCILPFHSVNVQEDPRKWFCSSLCTRMLQRLGALKNEATFGLTPNALSDQLFRLSNLDGERLILNLNDPSEASDVSEGDVCEVSK